MENTAVPSSEHMLQIKEKMESAIRTYSDILDSAAHVNLESTDEVKRVTIKKGNVTSTDRNGEPIPNYRWAMAEKRANSRGILKLLGFYELGFFGQDEADDFNEVVVKGVAEARGSDVQKKGTTGTQVTSKMISG